MIKIFESFSELAEAMCDGESILHACNCAMDRYGIGKTNDPCLLWQSGVTAFAEWLDHIGLKVEIADNAANFYEFCAKLRTDLEGDINA